MTKKPVYVDATTAIVLYTVFALLYYTFAWEVSLVTLLIFIVVWDLCAVAYYKYYERKYNCHRSPDEYMPSGLKRNFVIEGSDCCNQHYSLFRSRLVVFILTAWVLASSIVYGRICIWRNHCISFANRRPRNAAF